MGISYNTSTVRDGLVLHLDAANIKSYPGTGTAWKDLSGAGNNGTLVNGVGYSSTNNGRMSFDKVNDNVSVPSINRGINTTIEIVFSTTAVSTDTAIRQYLYTQQRNPPVIANFTYKESQAVIITGNKLSFQYMNEINSVHSVVAELVLTPNTLYHIIVTLDYDIVRWFINGTEQPLSRTTVDNEFVSTNRKAKSFTVNQGRIALRGDAQGNDYFGGNVSLLRDYNRTLTTAEARQNFEAIRGRYSI